MNGDELAALATPDDGGRLSDVAVWDETTRPRGPARERERTYSAGQSAAGAHLVDVHDHLRRELGQLRDVLKQVVSGRLDPGTARSSINVMSMRQNDWTLGAFCAQYCTLVTAHHSFEDQGMFGHLRAGDPALAPVIDRLEDEHRVIHDVLEDVDRALVQFVSGPEGTAVLEHAMDVLTDALLSHLSYEERELVEPLARLGFF